ncbi:MAG: hypothetical protein RLZZ511_1716 [Cyanobacteriota bacterium]|jgi:uncharacterized membrane protein
MTLPENGRSESPLAARTPLIIAAIGGLVLFIAASLRHWFLRSGGYDLGIFDQALYLISQGKAPVSSLIGMHMMADHVSLVLYPIGWLYKIFPSVHLLFFLQTFSLAGGVIPLYYLCRQSNLSRNQAIGLSVAYLLYPVTIFASLFDFNPQTLTIPFLLGSIYFARDRKIWAFVACIAMVMACRDASSLTVIFLGIWLLGFEKRRLAGAIAIVTGIAWFVITSKFISPAFVAPGTVSTVDSIIIRNYGYLGSSFGEILKNIFFRPDLWIGQLFQKSVIRYLAVLIIPLVWGLSPRHLAPMVGALPTLAMNILAVQPNFRDLKYYYDLPILVFIFVALISAMQADRTWIKRGRTIVLWTCALIVLGVGARLATSNIGNNTDSGQFQASREAIQQVRPGGKVLTTHSLAPQISQRETIHVYPIEGEYVNVFRQVDSLKHLVASVMDVSMYDQILLRRPAQLEESADRTTSALIDQLQTDSRFKLTYDRAGVYLFDQIRR